MIRIILSAGSIVVLVGCSVVGPNYEVPTMDVTPTFMLGGDSTLSNANADPWWQRLNDPILNELVSRGAQQNLNVRSALERITAANARLGQTGTNAQSNGALPAAVQQRGDSSGSDTTNNLAINAGYVIDLFGGFAREQERSIANLEAAQLDVGTIRLAYLADLTNSYIQARYNQEAAAITRQTIASRRQTLAIVNERRSVEEATELEVQQARSLLASAQAPLPVFVANFEVNVFHIATLLAEPASPLLEQMQSGAPQPHPHGFTNVGLPADLLRNRPDLRVMERNLAAATAQIGVAEAQLYPSVQLSGTIAAGTADGWSFGPLLSLPVLNRGFLRARQQIAQSAARSSELDWRNGVLIAVEEVQVALTLCRNWNRQIQHLERAATASRSVLRLSRESYRLGEATLTDVLDAERINASNRMALADARRNYALSWMRVQVATGHGWNVEGMTFDAEGQAPVLPSDPLGLEGTVLVSGENN
ncbi:outer membrane protein, multidrug efflux system [Octadecabacter temperatus]|uniref:Toluene efflux pump outer membrane protein TtgI n=1 Tax=Octadecabacter temperatus TaxID=1458307 RepID=A0A0K0Y7S5_9RHOB|nr:efflux transporter outer membrane subunit [Octadecabacter temperatus]AKS46936.1 Toluene efflux pump outer membrane protein TtgI precursor [Octadecabacter temperatus]SIO23926.1 outer membrane protein, multidrug efflux system [Octadecabacter temperatus]